MNRKIYYNLTMIKNGWLLNYPTYFAETGLQSGTEESYYMTLADVLAFIEDHFEKAE